jgi:hypothetical protein
MTGGGRANWEERKPDHAPRPADSYRQNCHPQLSNAENDARRTATDVFAQRSWCIAAGKSRPVLRSYERFQSSVKLKSR